MACPLAGGYQQAAPPVLPLEEYPVLSPVGKQEAVAVSATLAASNTGADLFPVAGAVSSTRSTQEKEEVQARDCRSPRDQKVPAEHRPSPSKAPVLTTRTRFSSFQPHMQQWVLNRFVGSRSRTGHDDPIERLRRSRITVAEFGHPRSSRSGGSLPRPSVRRRVSLDPPTHKNRVKTLQNLTTSDQEPLCDPRKARHDHAARYPARSTNTWAVGRCMITPLSACLHLFRISCIQAFRNPISLFSRSPCVPHVLHPHPPIATPLPSTRSPTTTIITGFPALCHTNASNNYEYDFLCVKFLNIRGKVSGEWHKTYSRAEYFLSKIRASSQWPTRTIYPLSGRADE